jgi:hypothetical protein
LLVMTLDAPCEGAMTSRVSEARRSRGRVLVGLSLLNVLALALFFALAAAGWPGTPSGCLTRRVCYCEAPVSGWVRQPANTWSNLICLPIALAIAYASRARDTDGRDDDEASLGLVFALALSAQGIGSMLFHASLVKWGAVVDAVTLILTPALGLGVNLERLGYVRRGTLPLFLVLSAGVALGFRLFVLPVMAPFVALFVLGFFATELLLRGRPRTPASARSLRAVLWLTTAAVAVWALSLAPGFPLCPRELPWGHALFHVIAAALTLALWFHARAALGERVR